MNENRASRFAESDPRHHTAKMAHGMRGLMEHLRADVHKVDDARARVLFETSAEVLGALAKAFEDYESKSEPAFREANRTEKDDAGAHGLVTDEGVNEDRTGASGPTLEEGEPVPGNPAGLRHAGGGDVPTPADPSRAGVTGSRLPSGPAGSGSVSAPPTNPSLRETAGRTGGQSTRTDGSGLSGGSGAGTSVGGTPPGAD